MKQNMDYLTKELKKLPRTEQLEIVKFLLLPDKQILGSDEVELAWEKEITDRIHAIDEGTAKGIDYDSAMQQIERQYQS